MNKPFVFFSIVALFLSVSCQSDYTLTPKPRGFPKVVFPKGSFQKFAEDYCSFSFDFPSYTQIQKDTLFFDKEPASSCWFDVYYPTFDCRIHCSYYPVNASKPLEELKKDAFELVDWHMKKANYIDEIPVKKPDGTTGFIFDIGGPAASPFQFYLTDSTQHFLRGAIYFNTQAKPDSLAPVYEFVKADALKMIESLEWNQ